MLAGLAGILEYYETGGADRPRELHLSDSETTAELLEQQLAGMVGRRGVGSRTMI